MIIHSHQAKATNKNKSSTPSKEAPKEYNRDYKINVPSRFTEGISNSNVVVDEKNKIKNNLEFVWDLQKIGSITHDTFYDWCLHFIKHLL